MKFTEFLEEQQTVSNKFIEQFAQYIQTVSNEQLQELSKAFREAKVRRTTFGPRRSKVSPPPQQ